MCWGSEEQCQCGCRGWCTLYPLLRAWVADLKGLESGDVRYAVLDVMGDWPAFLQIFGLRYWSHAQHPCPLCRVNQIEMCKFNISGWTVDSMPFASYETDDYKADLQNFVKACGSQKCHGRYTTLLIYLSFSFESLYPEGCHHWIQNAPIWDLPEVGLQEKTPGTCPQWWRPCTRAEERPPPDADPGLVGCGTVWIHGTSLRDFLVDRAREWSIGAWLPPTGIGWGWPRNMEPWYSTFLAFGPPAVVGQPCIELLLGFRPMGTFFCWFGCCRKTEIESVCNQIWTLSILPGPEKRPAVGREVLWSFLDRFYFFPSIHDKKLCLDKWTKQRCNLLMCESYHLRFGIWLWLCLGQLTAPVSMRRLQKVMASHSSSGICWKCTCQVSSRNYQLTRLGEVNIF